MKENNTPEPIIFSDPIFDFSFHPKKNLVVAGLITGHVYCYQYDNDANILQWSTQISKKSCRGVEFNHDGSLVMTISRDKSIQTIDMTTGRLLQKIPKAHRYPINKIHALDINRIATGDDEGVIKIWDMRSPSMIQQYNVHDDFIADMTFAQDKSCLLASGGDGMLSVHDIRKLDKKVATCILDDELLSLTTIKHDHQVVVGSQSGALYFWEWGEWTKVKDKWVGHPSSVDTLCKLDEDTICTGGNDGLLRLVSVSPQYQFEGIIGDHGEDFPVERVRLSHDGPLLDEESSPICLLGSCGHDMQLRFWDIGYLYGPDSDQSDDGTENDDRNNDSTSTKKRHDSSSSPKTTTMGHTKRMKHQNFFLDL